VRWTDWKERVRDSPRPFLSTYSAGAAAGVVVIVLGGLMTASPYGRHSSRGSPVWGIIVLGVGVLILSASIALTVMAVGYWMTGRRRKRDEILHP